MQKNYTTKDIKKSTKMKAPKKDGDIFEKNGVWVFKWKGSECGFLSEDAAKKGLMKVSGKAKTKS